jgi:hypothetical protein
VFAVYSNFREEELGMLLKEINMTSCYLRGRNMDAKSNRRECTENVFFFIVAAHLQSTLLFMEH